MFLGNHLDAMAASKYRTRPGTQRSHKRDEDTCSSRGAILPSSLVIQCSDGLSLGCLSLLHSEVMRTRVEI